MNSLIVSVLSFALGTLAWWFVKKGILLPYSEWIMYLVIAYGMLNVLPFIATGLKNRFTFVKVAVVMIGAYMLLSAAIVNPIHQLGLTMALPIYILVCLFILSFFAPGILKQAVFG